MDLSGQWYAAPAREELRRTFHEPALDDRQWHPVTVPGHWAQTPALSEERAVLFRHRFQAEPPAENRRRWLTLGGLAQQGDVWLNGSYVGDTDGYFVPHRFEVTDLMQDSAEHTLAIDVTCGAVGDTDERTDLLGALIDPQLSGAAQQNPGGIWQPVGLEETGLWAIHHFRAVCSDANPNRAQVTLRCVFDSPANTTVVLRTRIGDHEHDYRHPSAVGQNRVEWTVEVENPELWWPHALKPDQAVLHDLRCELIVDGDVQDYRTRRIGLRRVSMRNWTLFVNGERTFMNGVVMLPTNPQPGLAEPHQVRHDVALARDTGFTMIRLAAHVAHPELYRAADEVGLLLWQEMPLRGVMARGVRTQAVRQTREMVDLLGHHPSVAVWCVHDEPFKRQAKPTTTPPIVGQQRPSWNRSVLDTSVRRVLQRTDGTRPVVLHTAVPPHLPQLDGTTSHLWFGWHDRRPGDLSKSIRRLPRMARLVTAFGAATVNPEHPAVVDAIWPAADWAAIGASIGARPPSLRHFVPPEQYPDGPTWAAAGFAEQAQLLRTTIETFRQLKYQPTNGFFAFYWADPGPAGGFGLLTSDRQPKPALGAAATACQPVLAVADPVPVEFTSGQPLTVTIQLISDLRHPLTEGKVVATLLRADGTTATQAWAGSIPADRVERIGRFEAEIGPRGDAVLELRVTGSSPDGPVTSVNRYQTTVR